MLRRLLVVGLVSLCFAGPAQAGTVAIFYYAWYGTPARDGSWQHWDQNGHVPPSDLYSRYYPARGAYSSSDPAVVNSQMAEIAAAGVERGDRLVVGARLDRGRAPADGASPPLGGTDSRRRSTSSRMPTARRTPSSQDVTYLASLGVRDIYVYHPRDIAAADWATLRPQLPASVRLFAGTQLVGFAAAAKFDGFYTYDFLDFGGAKFAASARRRTPSTSSAHRPSVPATTECAPARRF